AVVVLGVAVVAGLAGLDHPVATNALRLAVAVARLSISVSGVAVPVARLSVSVSGVAVAVARVSVAVAGVSVAVARIAVAVARIAVARIALARTAVTRGLVAVSVADSIGTVRGLVAAASRDREAGCDADREQGKPGNVLGHGRDDLPKPRPRPCPFSVLRRPLKAQSWHLVPGPRPTPRVGSFATAHFCAGAEASAGAWAESRGRSRRSNKRSAAAPSGSRRCDRRSARSSGRRRCS